MSISIVSPLTYLFPLFSLLKYHYGFNRLFTRDARIELKQRVQQHALVELAHIVIFVPSASVETSGATTASLAWLSATSGTRAPDRTTARREHPRLGRFSHWQLVLGELVLARWFGCVRRAMMVTMMMVMVMQTIAGVQLALLVRLRMVPYEVEGFVRIYLALRRRKGEGRRQLIANKICPTIGQD